MKRIRPPYSLIFWVSYNSFRHFIPPVSFDCPLAATKDLYRFRPPQIPESLFPYLFKHVISSFSNWPFDAVNLESVLVKQRNAAPYGRPFIQINFQHYKLNQPWQESNCLHHERREFSFLLSHLRVSSSAIGISRCSFCCCHFPWSCLPARMALFLKR